MTITDVLAVLPSANFKAAAAWYERLVGRPADRRPMDGLVEWQLCPGGAIQLTESAEHAGSAQVTVGVDDVEAYAAELAERGLSLQVTDTASGQFRIGTIKDLDGNAIVFAQTL